VFVNRASSHRLSVKVALARYLSEVTPTKRHTTQYREHGRIRTHLRTEDLVVKLDRAMD
jgi:hypothetical protein